MKEYKQKPRTDAQNRSLHLFLKILAGNLNAAGLDQRVVLKPGVSIPWTATACKEMLWRPIQVAMYQKKSTTQLAKLEEINNIHEVLMRELGEKHHVEFIPWPHFEHGQVDDEGRVYLKSE